MQRRKALLQIENILILLMLSGRRGNRQREKREMDRRKMKENPAREQSGLSSFLVSVATNLCASSPTYADMHDLDLKIATSRFKTPILGYFLDNNLHRFAVILALFSLHVRAY